MEKQGDAAGPGRPLSSIAELNELHYLVGGLQRCVTSLQSRYGDVPAVRRIANDAERILNDVERLDIDDGELDVARGTARHDSGERSPVPDTQYDIEFWRDADDEGVGGHHTQR
jgi:hypothetical protein